MTGTNPTPSAARALPDAHELFAASQLGPHEGIEDAVARIQALLGTQPVATALPEELLTNLRRLRQDTSRGDEIFRLGYNACLDRVLKILTRAVPASEASEPAEPVSLKEGEAR
jgi:hypothetical protein